MKMDLDFETVLDVALGGPEIGPLNLYVLHGLMKEVFQKFDLSEKSLIIEEKDPNFCDAYNFIKSKVDENKTTPRTAGGGYSRDRSKVSVIVSDYVRSPIGKGAQNESKPPIIPADVEDRLRYVESELKIVQNFPTVDELRTWAQEKTSPDTVVTDLWHFVSLNSRMGGAELGIQKLSELIDKLIPELKKLQDEQHRLQGQIDDLSSQMQGVSDRTTRIDNRIDNAGELAEKKVKDLTDDMEKLEEKMSGYAKLMDLEDFLLAETFIEEKNKAMVMAEEMQNDIDSKAPLSMLDDLQNQEELKRLADEINNLHNEMESVALKDDLPELESYVKWPQLEDALLNRSSRPNSSTSKRSGSQYGSRQGSRQSGRQGSIAEIQHDEQASSREGSVVGISQVTGYEEIRPSSRSSTLQGSGQGSQPGSRRDSQIASFEPIQGDRPSSIHSGSRRDSLVRRDSQTATSDYGQGDRPSSSRPDSRRSSRMEIRRDSQMPSYDHVILDRPSSSRQGSQGSRPGSHKSDHRSPSPKTKYPTEECLQKLRDIGMLAERQKAIMDALEATREQLALKADKSDLEGMLTQDDLNDLLNLLGDLREEINGLQRWREHIDEEKVPAMQALLSDLEQQVSDLLNKLAEVADEQMRKQKSIDTLFTHIDDLEEKKLDKDDPLLHRPAVVTADRSDETDFDQISKHSDDTDHINKVSDVDPGKMATKEELYDAIDDLKKRLKELLDKLNDHENDCNKKFAGIIDDLDEKLDRAELQPLREYLENRYNTLSKQDEEEHQQPQHPKKGNRKTKSAHVDSSPKSKQSKAPNHSYTFSHTMSQDIPPSQGSPHGHGKASSTPGYNPSKGTSSYNGYVMDDSECSHPHYGDGGFLPKKKEAAAFRTQMKFNCLSCDRPLTMQTNSHLQTIRGKPLNAYELDQLRLLQRILKGDNPGKATRACGGKHTSSTPTKRITARINSSKSLPAMSRDDPDELLVDGEVDIEGIDGRFYRGLISQQDLKNHSRSKSANAQLRTVSPRPKSGKDRPISGKSVDFTSSFNSANGTTRGSIDFQIEE